jgi:hypothetical protein
MKRYLLAVVLPLVMLAAPASASASPYNRNCGTRQDGWVFGPEDADYEAPWIVNGPWHINITEGEAIRLTRVIPIQEFGVRDKLSGTLCFVAEGIAESASIGWVNWPGDEGWVNVVAYTSGAAAQFGRFYCTGYDLPAPAVAKETCTRKYWGGKVVGSFTIRRIPCIRTDRDSSRRSSLLAHRRASSKPSSGADRYPAEGGRDRRQPGTQARRGHRRSGRRSRRVPGVARE